MEKMETPNESKTTTLVRSILTTEVKFILGVIGFVMGVVTPYYSLKQDVALIQKDISTINSNHMQHTQDLAQGLKDTITLVQSQQAEINELQKQNAVILSKLKP